MQEFQFITKFLLLLDCISLHSTKNKYLFMRQLRQFTSYLHFSFWSIITVMDKGIGPIHASIPQTDGSPLSIRETDRTFWQSTTSVRCVGSTACSTARANFALHASSLRRSYLIVATVQDSVFFAGVWSAGRRRAKQSLVNDLVAAAA